MADAPASQPSPLARLDRLPVWPYPYRILVVVGAGFFFAFFDIVNIGFALPVIAKQLGVSEAAASSAITSGLVGYIIGAYVTSTIADAWGRRLSLVISVALFTAGSVGAALSGSLVLLVIFRFVAGLGIGAEIASVATYLGEMSPARLRGRYTSIATTCAYAGFAVVPPVALLLVPNWSFGWRLLFLIGAAGGLTILFMRRTLPPSPRWLVTQGRVDEAEAIVADAEARARDRIGGDELPPPLEVPSEATAERFPTLSLLRRPYVGRVLLFIAIWFVYYIGNYGWLTLAPTLLQKHGYNLEKSIGYLILSGVGFVVGAYATSRFSDRFERKYATAVVAIVWAVTLVIIGLFPVPGVVIGLGFLASVTIGLLVPVMYTYTAEHFSTRARASGVALTDGLGHIGGAIAPLLVLGANNLWGFAGAFIVMAVSGVVTAALLLLGIRATGRSLEAVS